MRLQFWFDFASPYSYLTAMRIEPLAEAAGVRIDWRAFLLGPIFAAQGWKDSPFNLYPAKGRYLWQDVRRGSEALGLPYAKPSQFPRNGVLAARIACCYADADWLPVFVREVYRANFALDLDIAATETVAGCLSSAGQDPDTVMAGATDPRVRHLLRERTEEAGRLDIFGAPTLRVGDDLYWGNDRLEAALDACRARGAAERR